jgi:MHS family proline/betaine transporter-like MFS transporter
MMSFNSKRTLGAVSIGILGEIYDFAVFALSVPILAAHFFPNSDPAAAVLSTFAVYAVAYFARPLGGVLFGYLADRIGRVRVMVITIWLMAAGTGLIGLLPTYASIGILAPILLVICRISQGLAMGGETTSSTSYILESAPDDRRGYWVGVIWFFAFIPNALAALLLAGIQFGAGAAYAEWVWRVPFLIGGLIGIIGFWLRRGIDESKEFKDASRQTHVDNPLVAATRGGMRPTLFVFIIQPLHTVGSILLLGYLYTFLVRQVGLDPTLALLTNAVAVAALSVMNPVGGWLSDRVGRKRVMSAGALWLAVVAYPAVYLASSGSVANALFGQLLVALGIGLYGGAAFPAAVEFFPTSYRATGHAIAYQIAVAFFGGTTPLVATWLISTFGMPLLPGAYVAFVATVTLLAIQFVPETKGISLRAAIDGEADEPVAQAPALR